MSFRLENNGTLPKDYNLVPPPGGDLSGVDRFVGSLLGLSVGDALGACVEFRPRSYLLANPVREMKGGGTWSLKAGQWTDDTSMALCLASSLIEKNRYDPYDQMIRYKWWYKQGYLSSTGQCFDIGNATRDSIEMFIRRQRTLGVKTDVDRLSWTDVKRMNPTFNINCSEEGVAGNGALMRLGPVPLFFSRYPELAVEYAGQSGRITHGDTKAVDCCRFYAALIVAAVEGRGKEEILDNDFVPKHLNWFGKKPLHPEVMKVARGSYKNDKGYEGGIRGKGYIVNALEAALWAFWSTKNFREGALEAVNLGDDTDTTAAIYGQLAGAFYGVKGIPPDWLKQLYAKRLLERLSEWICVRANEYRPNEEDRLIPVTGQQTEKTIPVACQSGSYGTPPSEPPRPVLSPPPVHSGMTTGPFVVSSDTGYSSTRNTLRPTLSHPSGSTHANVSEQHLRERERERERRVNQHVSVSDWSNPPTRRNDPYRESAPQIPPSYGAGSNGSPRTSTTSRVHPNSSLQGYYYHGEWSSFPS